MSVRFNRHATMNTMVIKTSTYTNIHAIREAMRPKEPLKTKVVMLADKYHAMNMIRPAV